MTYRRLSKEDLYEILNKAPEVSKYEVEFCKTCGNDFGAYVRNFRKYCSVKCAKERNNYE